MFKTLNFICLMMLYSKFGWKWSSVFGGHVENVKSVQQTDGQTDGQQINCGRKWKLSFQLKRSYKLTTCCCFFFFTKFNSSMNELVNISSISIMKLKCTSCLTLSKSSSSFSIFTQPFLFSSTLSSAHFSFETIILSLSSKNSFKNLNEIYLNLDINLIF